MVYFGKKQADANKDAITQLNNKYDSLSNYVNTVSLKNVTKNQPITTGQTWDGVPITALYYDRDVNLQDGETTLPNLNGVRKVFITDLYLWVSDDALKLPYVDINQNNAIVSHARFKILTNEYSEQIKIISKGLSGSKKITGWIFYWKRG